MKQKAERELPGDKSREKKMHTEHSGENKFTEMFLSIVCTAPASWDFSVAHGGMYNIEQCVNSNCHINKGKAIGST